MFAVSRCCLRYASRRTPAFGTVVGGGRRPRRTGAPESRLHNQQAAVSAKTVAEAEVVDSTTSTWKDAKRAAVDHSGRTRTSKPETQLHRSAGSAPLPPYPQLCAIVKPVVLEDVQDTYAITPTQEVRGQHLWTATKLLRSNKHMRKANAACVVGGASAIRRIWRTYNIRPHVVYVPKTESAVPAWCLEEALPTVIVRCSPVDVKRHLLSAEYSDGYAAEFPLPENCVTEATALLAPPPEPAQSETLVPSTSDTRSPSDTPSPTGPQAARPLHSPFAHHAVGAMLVLVGLRIPSNVGLLLRAAADMAYDAVVLVNCADPTQEKVLRASDGTALSPTLRIYETEVAEQACVSLLSGIAAQHHLLPLLAVPSQEVEPAFEVAKRFHVCNATKKEAAAPVVSGDASVAHSNSLRAPPPPRLGAMVILGSEARGLRDLKGQWGVPYQLVSLPLPNAMVDSLNVSVAGSVLMHLFRPGAAPHFTRLVELSGEVIGDLLPASMADDEESGGLAGDGRVNGGDKTRIGDGGAESACRPNAHDEALPTSW
ncbi:hypothetical protein LSCM1_05126 [Leishmania martiniquensis]|uniref:tRNA/rRNA methyltransferase SpoU type domain-containing protein n=1 Tax=Leishmania martiniquensis TaxID=1580590 RepID=A0A836GPW5_9TRYP|nr:hypothetical protein LSCM1_05126 [Leishmania martiniquensis]